MSEWILERVPSLQGYAVNWVDPGEILASRRNALYRSKPGGTLQPFANYPVPRWKGATTTLRLVQRLLRFFYYNVVKLSDDRLFVTFDKSLAIYANGRFEPVTGASGFRVLHSACALSDDGSVYFGEYCGNRERDIPIRIYRLRPGSSRAEVVHTFEPGAVRHIHGIYRDPTDGSLWATSGDREGECRVLWSEDGFRTFDVVGAGDETWRTVSLAFTDDAIYYGTDAEFEQNYLYRIDRRSGCRDVIGELDGPVYYCYSLGSDLFFAVTAELCPSQIGRSATLWHVSRDDHLEPVRSFEKDRYSGRFFQYGTLHFAGGPGTGDEILMHGVALREADNVTYSLRRSR